MIPPYCRHCGTDFRSDPKSGRRVKFKRTDAQIQAAKDARAKRHVGYDDGRHWFCVNHFEQAQALNHLSITDALQVMKQEPDVPDIDPVAKPRENW